MSAFFLYGSKSYIFGFTWIFFGPYFSQDDDGLVDKTFCDSNLICWGNGQCNSFLNNEKHCFDGGDCSRKFAKKSECNDRSCCNDVTAIMVEICRECNCNELEPSVECKECCSKGLGTNGSESMKVESTALKLVMIHIWLHLLSLRLRNFWYISSINLHHLEISSVASYR